MAGFGRQIHFASDDGLHLDGFGRLIEFDRAVKIAVMGDGQSRHLHLGHKFQKFAGFSFFVGEARRAIEERIFGMGVKMNERIGGACHLLAARCSLLSTDDPRQSARITSKSEMSPTSFPSLSTTGSRS